MGFHRKRVGTVALCKCMEALEPRALLAATPLYPDLTPWLSAARQYTYNWQIDKTSQPGRTLLRLSYNTANIGAGPVELHPRAFNPDGSQQVNQRIYNSDGSYSERLAGNFVYHAAHNHIHFEEFAQFSLRGVTSGGGVGSIVAGGEKTSFCLLDVAAYDTTLPGAPSSRVYVDCAVQQGLSVGWGDLYTKDTPGQEIDVTGLSNGSYWLEVQADPANRLMESNEGNNIDRIKIDLHLSDDSLAAAYTLGALGPTQTYNEFVGSADLRDYYKFTLSAEATVNVVLKDLYANANVQLLSSTGSVIASSSKNGSTSESITQNLAAGTYYVSPFRSSGDTTYTLEVGTAGAPPPDTINGTSGNDAIRLVRNANPDLFDVFVNNASATPNYSVNIANLGASVLHVLGLAGDDTLTVDFANGSFAPGGGISFDGGADTDTLEIVGSAGADHAVFNSASVILNPTVNHINIETRTFDGNGGGDSLTVDGGSVALTATQVLSSLLINAGAVLDVRNHDLLIDYSGDSPYGDIYGYAAAGRNTGVSGIVSTLTPAGDTVLAIAEQTDWGFSEFNGVPIDDTTIVCKYTFYGDANLDGMVTSDDYVAVEVGLGSGDSWVQGDFNFSGTVTSDDYVAIDVNLGKGLSAAAPAAVVAPPPGEIVTLSPTPEARKAEIEDVERAAHRAYKFAFKRARPERVARARSR